VYNAFSRRQEIRQCGRLTPEYLDFARMMDRDPSVRLRETLEFYLQFSSDDSVNYKGFNFTFVAETECKL